jgi:hypothetical protein
MKPQRMEKIANCATPWCVFQLTRAESSLVRRKSLICSWISESSLPFLKKFRLWSLPVAHESSPYQPIPILKPMYWYHFSTPALISLLISFVPVFPPKSYIYSCSPNACYIPCLSYHPWLHHSNYIWWRVKIKKRLM